MTTPYIAFNIYSRGALAEIWALIWISLGLWLTDKVLKKENFIWRILLAILVATISITHVPSLLLFTASYFIYLTFLGIRYSGNRIKICLIVIHVFIGFGLVSCYLLPAILEKSLVNIDFMRFDDGYKKNLISFGLIEANKFLNKIIEPIFLYQLGIILLLVIILLSCGKRNKKILSQYLYWLIYLAIIAVLCTYLSLPIWQLSKTLQMVQFPWRLLGLFAWGVASLFSLTVNQLQTDSNKLRKTILLAIILALIGVNIIYSYKISLKLPGYQNPGNIAAAKAKGSWKASIYEQIKIAIENPYDNLLKGTNEYRPLLEDGNPSPPPKIGQQSVSLVKGKAQVKIEKWDSYQRLLQVIAATESTIRIRTYYFPVWHLYLGRKPHPVEVAQDGTILITVPQGTHNLELRYQHTQTFKIGIVFSVFSLFTLVCGNLWLSRSRCASAKPRSQIR